MRLAKSEQFIIYEMTYLDHLSWPSFLGCLELLPGKDPLRLP